MQLTSVSVCLIFWERKTDFQEIKASSAIVFRFSFHFVKSEFIHLRNFAHLLPASNAICPINFDTSVQVPWKPSMPQTNVEVSVSWLIPPHKSAISLPLFFNSNLNLASQITPTSPTRDLVLLTGRGNDLVSSFPFPADHLLWSSEVLSGLRLE